MAEYYPGAYLYSTCSKQRDMLIDEKIYLLADYFTLLILYQKTFKGNSNLDAALESLTYGFADLFAEVNRIHDLYDSFM